MDDTPIGEWPASNLEEDCIVFSDSDHSFLDDEPPEEVEEEHHILYTAYNYDRQASTANSKPAKKAPIVPVRKQPVDIEAVPGYTYIVEGTDAAANVTQEEIDERRKKRVERKRAEMEEKEKKKRQKRQKMVK